jgi:hypothetical protein
VADRSVGGVVLVEEVGAVFVCEGGGLVLVGGASVRCDGVGELVGGGLLGGDDVIGGDRSACAETGGPAGQGHATVGQFVGSAGDVIAGVGDVIGHLLVVTPRGHGAADVIFPRLRPAGDAR